MLKRAIACFEAQTYSNKELVVLYEEDDLLTKKFLGGNNFSDAVKILEVKIYPKNKLGSLRNIAIGHSKGMFVCQWDDDDWCHAGRLEYQYTALLNTTFEASVLTQWLVFDSTRGNAYVSNRRLWEGSVLCRKEIIQRKRYEHLEKGEDTPVVDYLKANNYICEIGNKPGAYIYIYHGNNTWHSAHWDNIFRCSLQLTAADSGRIKAVLDGEVSNIEGSLLIDRILDL
jgi:glycosyltransferase involved in cell wall biosynthesis